MSFTSVTFSNPRVLYIKCTTCFSWFATQFYVICATDIERNKHDTDKLSRGIACIGVLRRSIRAVVLRAISACVRDRVEPVATYSIL